MKNFKEKFTLLTFITFLLLTSCKKDEKKIDNPIPKTDTTLSLNDTINKDSIITNEKNDICIKESKHQLPYNQKIDINKVEYDICNCKIDGINELLCDDPDLRYISLPDFGKMKVILVPLDCADFNYNFYMAVISENKLISKLYAEGEWYEPENESYKEITSFTIDKNYEISITKKSLDNEKVTATELTEYEIDSSGNFVKSK